MLARLPRLAVVIALSCSIGLHWAFFQSLAWVGMVVSYAQNATFEQALVKTFDGKHPCPLCQAIAKSKRSEQKSEPAPLVKKFEFLAEQAQFIFTAPAHGWLLTAAEPVLQSVSLSPPTPPPRGFLL